MPVEFEIIKIIRHHNRGHFIVARQLNFKKLITVTNGSSLNGIPVYHYLAMYPLTKEDAEPEYDIYVFRPVNLITFSEELFKEGQKVELALF